MTADVIDHALKHEQHLRPSADVWVDGDGEYSIIVFAVDPIELVEPELFDVSWVYKSVAVRRRLYKHHGRQIVEVPAGRKFDKVDLVPMF